MIKKCIIPATGRGTNWLPVSEFVPKEMFPVLKYPIIHYTFQEAFRSGLTEIAIVITYDKEIIRNYLHSKFSSVIGNGYTLEFIYQEEPLGIGDAILQCEHFIQGEPFAVILPDDLYFFQSFPLTRLIDIYSQEPSPSFLVGLTSVSKDLIDQYICFNLQKKSSQLCTISKFYSKSEQESNTSSSYRNSLRLVGRYLLSPVVFDCLQELKQVEHKGVLSEDILFNFMLSRGENIYGTIIKEECFDIDTLQGYVNANHTFFNF